MAALTRLRAVFLCGARGGQLLLQTCTRVLETVPSNRAQGSVGSSRSSSARFQAPFCCATLLNGYRSGSELNSYCRAFNLPGHGCLRDYLLVSVRLPRTPRTRRKVASRNVGSTSMKPLPILPAFDRAVLHQRLIRQRNVIPIRLPRTGTLPIAAAIHAATPEDPAVRS